MEAEGKWSVDLAGIIRVVKRCHTVVLSINMASLLSENQKFSNVLVPAFQDKLKGMFENPPPCLFQQWDSSGAFLKRLVEEAGPIFAVIDDIGSAFMPFSSDNEDLNIQSTLESRRRFFNFCEAELLPWMTIPSLFFLLAGRGSFLSYVGRRPDAAPGMTGSPVGFERLSLHALQPDPIQDILRNTLFCPECPETLQQHFHLDDSQLRNVANHLFSEVNGRPRLLVVALRTSKDYTSLRAWKKPQDHIRWPHFLRAARRKMNASVMLVHSILSGTSVDLTQQYDEGGKLLPLDLIATEIGLSWDGNLCEATLFADQLLLQQVMGYGLSFEDYLDSISKQVSVSLDFPTVFQVEWIFALGFTSMFAEANAPKVVRPSFFATEVFGTLDFVKLHRNRHPLPKITGTGSLLADLSGSTAHWSIWPQLLQLMDRYGPCTWKPGHMSASPDVILTTDIPYCGYMAQLTIGLAVKCYKTSELTKSQISEECEKFSRMFSDQNVKGRLNILFICATKYRLFYLYCNI